MSEIIERAAQAVRDTGLLEYDDGDTCRALARAVIVAIREEPCASTNPERSSGEPWTELEDDILRRLMGALIRAFPTRSAAAVLSRIEHSRSLDGWRWPARA